ncbi:MAG: hypothetical protein RLZZ28_2246 [Bacteroidota bacterium]|jgi:hypothetical protein
MSKTPSIMGLHLRYRVWIAELNHDITLLRIFDDYLKETKEKKISPEIALQIKAFKKQFSEHRDLLDDLRHTMHLHKMDLASEAKQNAVSIKNNAEMDDYQIIKDKYAAYRVSFETLYRDFSEFVEQWLQ